MSQLGRKKTAKYYTTYNNKTNKTLTINKY